MQIVGIGIALFTAGDKNEMGLPANGCLWADPKWISGKEEKLSAFTEKGILEATASVSQTPQRQTHISLNGRGVPVNILQQWGWPELPLTGDGNIQLTASGDIQANAPLKPTVSGQLHAVNAAKQQVTQTMNAGIVSSGEVTSTEPVR